jgi:hypothetical protein
MTCQLALPLVDVQAVWDWHQHWRFGPLRMESGYEEHRTAALADLARRLGVPDPAPPASDEPVCSRCGRSEAETGRQAWYPTGRVCPSCADALLKGEVG